MHIRYAEKNDTDSIKEIWSYCFNDSEKFMDYYFNNKYDIDNTVVVDEREDVVSSLQLNQYKLRLNDKVYDVSYIVGVSTFPQVRGMGYMKNIMTFSLKELYKKGQLISILMPIDYRLYRKYGYEHCYDQLEYKIDINSLSSFKVNGRMYKVNDSYIEEIIKINDNFLNELNGNIVRDNNYYKNLFKEVESEDGHIYIHENNGYEGYIIYFLNGEEMFVRELFYKNIESLKSMLKFIYNHNTQCKKIIISAPINDKIRFILDNPKDSEIRIKPFMMGRVINLKKYLETLNINKNIKGNTVIKIEDKFIEENNGVFHISINNGNIKVNKVEDDFKLQFSINIITQLIFSYIDVNESLMLSNIEENECNKKDIDLLKLIFNKKENYINEYI